jgi:hypothetical protein
MRAPLASLALLALAWSLGACAGVAIRSDEIPERPIALSYYDVETLRRRAEEAAAADPRSREAQRLGVARVDDVAAYLGRLLGAQSSEAEEAIERRLPGRLAWLDPRDEQVRLVEGALPGALPRARSADGQRMLFSQVVSGFRQLFELDLASGEVRTVTRGPAVHPDGCFGPEGRYVYVTARVAGDRPVSTIALTEPGGRAPSPISEGPADYAPACAPDGRAIAWVAVDDRGRDHVWSRMPALDGPVRRLGPGRDPAFSPDGEWIVYSALVQGQWRLYRIRPDGSARRALGRGTLDELQPSVSPDGRMVVYVSDDGLEKKIYLRRLDGSGDRVLLRSGGGEHPVW